MKVSQLKSLIKEAVREAIREELSEMKAPQATPIQEVVQSPPPPAPKAPEKTGNAILDALNETKYTTTAEEYRTMFNGNSGMVQAPGLGMQSQTPTGPAPGIDLSQLDFAKKAGAIFKRSNELDRAK